MQFKEPKIPVSNQYHIKRRLLGTKGFMYVYGAPTWKGLAKGMNEKLSKRVRKESRLVRFLVYVFVEREFVKPQSSNANFQGKILASFN